MMSFRSRSKDRLVSACACGDHGFVELPHAFVALFPAGMTNSVAASAPWCMQGRRGRKYPASVSRHAGTVYLHRHVAGAKDGDIVDHVNGDPLDARSGNLRICDALGNSRNRRAHRGSNCKFKGVYFHSKLGVWSAKIYADRQTTFLGYFGDPRDAAAAYDRACVDLHGEFASPNSGLFPAEVWE